MQLSTWPCQRQYAFIDQSVVNDDIGLQQGGKRVECQQSGVSGSGADEPHFTRNEYRTGSAQGSERLERGIPTIFEPLISEHGRLEIGARIRPSRARFLKNPTLRVRARRARARFAPWDLIVIADGYPPAFRVGRAHRASSLS